MRDPLWRGSDIHIRIEGRIGFRPIMSISSVIIAVQIEYKQPAYTVVAER